MGIYVLLIFIFLFLIEMVVNYIYFYILHCSLQILESVAPARVELPHSFTWLCSIPYVCMLCPNFLNKSSMEDNLRCLQYFAITKDAI